MSEQFGLEIRREFCAARRLPRLPEDHPCARMHGHTFRLTVTVEGALDPHLGWVMDFGEFERVVAAVVTRLDHHTLNEIEGLENPTSEHLARWIYRRLRPDLPGLASVAIEETGGYRCVIRNGDGASRG